MDAIRDLSDGALLGLGVLIAVQLALTLWALVVLFRTPSARLQFGSRWPWLAIILLGNTVGPIIFLAAGRVPAPPLPPSPDRTGGRAMGAVLDELYADREAPRGDASRHTGTRRREQP